MLLAGSARHSRLVPLVFAATMIASTVACGGGGDDDQVDIGSDDQSSVEEGSDQAAADEGGDQLGDELTDAMGAGGGGTLVFDGEEIVIESVTCQSNGDDFAVGTVSDNGFRVLIDSSSTGTPSSQILDPDLNQWTPLDRGESVQVGDDTYASPPTTYADIRDSSREVEVSYTIECP